MVLNKKLNHHHDSCGCGCGNHKHEHKHEHNFINGVCECGAKEQVHNHELHKSDSNSEHECCCCHENESEGEHFNRDKDDGDDDSEGDHSHHHDGCCSYEVDELDQEHHHEHEGCCNHEADEHDYEHHHKHGENCDCGHEHYHEHGEECGHDHNYDYGCQCGHEHVLNIGKANKAQNDTVKSELVIEGLHCAGCAAKIEKKVSALDEVASTVLNFATSTMILQTNIEDRDLAIKKASKIAEETEPGVSVKVKGEDEAVIKIFTLKGLNCAGCAAKIERNANNMEGVIEAKLNFALSKLEIKVNHDHSIGIGDKINKMVTGLEPDVMVIDNSIETEKGEKSPSKGKDKNTNRLLKRIGIALGFLGIGIFIKQDSIQFIIYIISYIIIGSDIIKRSINNIRRGEVFDENFLMTIATLASIWVGEYPEAIMVMLLYQVGEYFQGRAVESSRKSIANLMDIRPEYANLKIGTDIEKISPDKIKVDDIIVIKPGEKVPVDGVIIEGASSVDTKALTGEAVPQDMNVGDSITSGFINIDGLLTVRVTKLFKESAVSKILDLVENASAKKAKTELSITKFARYYTPIVVIIAVLIAVLPPVLFKDQIFNDWLLRGATFLVVSCPCALVISIPMSYFAGLGASSKNGVLVKGGNYLEALSNSGVLVFDKTGTLTQGKFKVANIITANNVSKEELLKYTAFVESFSTHPIATSIVDEFGNQVNKDEIKNYKETRGKGVQAVIEGIQVMSGNVNFLRDKGIDVKESELDGTIVYTAFDGQYAGCIVIKDQLKKDSKEAIEGFNNLGIENIVMLTGDRKITADAAAVELGIKNYKYELLPNEKVDEVEKLIQQKGDKSLVFVGDGINDAPVLARADVGVAMGGVGSDAAIEAADIVIMNDEPSKLIKTIKIAKKTKRIVSENIFMALSVKIVIMILAFFGLAPMWLAIFGDVGISIIAVFNAMRILNNTEKNQNLNTEEHRKNMKR